MVLTLIFEPIVRPNPLNLQQLDITHPESGVDGASWRVNVMNEWQSGFSSITQIRSHMQQSSFTLRVSVAILLGLSASGSRVQAQQPDSGGVSAVSRAPIGAAAMDAFVAAHIEIAAFRGKLQAELAEPRSKKIEIQQTLHEKLQAGVARLLKEHNLTDAEFTQMTRRVSTDDVVRQQFEEALTRLAKR